METQILSLGRHCLKMRRQSDFNSLLPYISSSLKQRITFIDPTCQDEWIFQWQKDGSKDEVNKWNETFQSELIYFKMLDLQTFHSMIEFASTESQVGKSHFFVVLGWEGEEVGWKYHNTCEIEGNEWNLAKDSWSLSFDEALQAFEKQKLNHKNTHREEEDDYWGMYTAPAMEPVADGQFPLEENQKKSHNQIQTQTQTVVHDENPALITDHFERRSSPEKRRFPDDAVQNWEGESTDMMDRSAETGNEKIKRPNLDLDQNFGDFKEKNFRSLLQTNIKSLYMMATLTGISKKEFLAIVNSNCD